MLDNELIILLIEIITAGLATYDLEDVVVKQSNQPTQQGANTGRTVYLSKLNDKRYGFLKREDVWNDLTESFDHTETQVYESVFQINAFAFQNPADTASLTASDLCNIVAAILQSDATLKTFFENDVGILRITDVRNPYFHNDADNFQASPSFDFTLTYKRVKTTQESKISDVRYGLYPI